MCAFYIKYFIKLNIVSILSVFSSYITTLVVSLKVYGALKVSSVAFLFNSLNSVKFLVASYIVFLGLVVSVGYFMFFNNTSNVIKFFNNLFGVIYSSNIKSYISALAIKIKNFLKSFF
jgi:hypothetical protein